MGLIAERRAGPMEIDSGTPYSSVQYNRGRVTGPCEKDFCWSVFWNRSIERESEKKSREPTEAPFTCYIESKLPEKILSLRIFAVESWEDDFQNPFLTRKGTKIDINYLFYAMVL